MENKQEVKPITITLKTAREQAEYYFNRECSPVPLAMLKGEIEGSLSEDIIFPSDEILNEEFKKSGFEDFDTWRDDILSDWHPMWSTVFLVSDFFAKQEYVDNLYKCGIGVIENEFGTFLFVPGAGYDFYEAHWIPMFTKVLPWIEYAK